MASVATRLMNGARTNNDSVTKPAETCKDYDLDVTAVLELVSDRYLMNDERFINAKLAIAKSYKDVIDSLADKSMLPYYPIIYPIPFMLSRKYRTEHLTQNQVIIYALLRLCVKLMLHKNHVPL